MEVHRGRILTRATAGLLVVALALALAAGEAAPAAQAGIAARCTVGDTLTRYRQTGDWYRSVLDTKLRVSRRYVPTGLVPVGRVGLSGGGYVRRFVIADLGAMYRAAKRAGARFAVTSAYRSYANQQATFWMWVRRSSYSRALLTSARPGHSEHQLGTTLDFMTPGGRDPWYYADWGSTPPGAWLRRNSWRYGFVMSYPKRLSPGHTCYAYEPWHFRYVGRVIAARIHASGLAPRDWLWLKGGTTTWTGGSPNPTPKPTPTPSPTVQPTPTPTESPTPEPTPTSAPTPEPTPTPAVEPSVASSPEPPGAAPADESG